ncbi:MAG: 16S rRNA (uracil(1498)-N(3))-methyltransferase [Chitinophagaceae bacterium]|nr:16S rRNA (uracil(1498)-N(3))-methyltransferase [Chitinophagaceae bacterium]
MVALFLHEGDLKVQAGLVLQDDTAKHVVQVLRMQPGDKLALTNGRGYRAECTIEQAHKRSCTVSVDEVTFYERPAVQLHLGVAFTKNSSRNEWILEKVTELGVATIIPLQASRSVREKFRFDRWNNILVSAILQSQQYWLPDLRPLTPLADLCEEMQQVPVKLVAHCMDGMERIPLREAIEKGKETLLLIGPEGDFTDEEVKELSSDGFAGVSMGINRLRTETAAVAACALFNMMNYD